MENGMEFGMSLAFCMFSYSPFIGFYILEYVCKIIWTYWFKNHIFKFNYISPETRVNIEWNREYSSETNINIIVIFKQSASSLLNFCKYKMYGELNSRISFICKYKAHLKNIAWPFHQMRITLTIIVFYFASVLYQCRKLLANIPNK